MLTHSDNLEALAPALAKFQGLVENASKDSSNPHFKSKYADLAEIINTAKAPLSECGLSLTQHPASYPDGGVIVVETLLLHSSGQWLKSELTVPCSKWDAQGVGSAITYGRRYGSAAVLGIAQEDDDGEGAVGRGTKAGQAQGSRPQQPPPPPRTDPAADDKARYKASREKAYARLITTMPEEDAKGLVGDTEKLVLSKHPEGPGRVTALISAMEALGGGTTGGK